LGHHVAVIVSFRDGEAQAIFEGGRSRRYSAIQRVIERKLAMLDVAKVLEDLRSPPGNRLEALQGDRLGQHSIRVNDQFRVCFVWTESGPAEVEIVDYH
jgi:proteic killer suppression protein